jgi:hypothetical protein
MNILFGDLFDLGAFMYLTGLLAAGLFFARMAISEIKSDHFDGLAYIPLALFFIGIHIVFLFVGKPQNTLFSFASRLDLISWFVLLFAPALVVLYLLFGLYDFIRMNVQNGLVRLFFGMTLVAFLYLIVPGWPMLFKALLTMLYCGVWVTIEVKTAEEAD